jgi:hypothetical protein
MLSRFLDPLTAIFLLLLLLLSQAQAMDFSRGGGEAACRDPDACKAWIMATGEFTSNTPAAFEGYLIANPYSPKVIRFNSPGGDLRAGILLGEYLRKSDFTTEAEFCASACVYAFLGGTSRVLSGPEAKIGVHRFYQGSALLQPTIKQFTGQDLDDIQKIMAGLMLYAVEMGVDLRLIAMSAEAGPGEMRWLTAREASELKVTYEPLKWLPWTLEGGDGDSQVIAVSQTQDGSKSMQFSCSSEGNYLVLVDGDEGPAWFEQCNQGPEGAFHPVLGQKSLKSETIIRQWNNSGAAVMFPLPDKNFDFSDPSLFTNTGAYPMACISYASYLGNSARMKAMFQAVIATCTMR